MGRYRETGYGPVVLQGLHLERRSQLVVYVTRNSSKSRRGLWSWKRVFDGRFLPRKRWAFLFFSTVLAVQEIIRGRVKFCKNRTWV